MHTAPASDHASGAGVEGATLGGLLVALAVAVWTIIAGIPDKPGQWREASDTICADRGRTNLTEEPL